MAIKSQQQYICTHNERNEKKWFILWLILFRKRKKSSNMDLFKWFQAILLATSLWILYFKIRIMYIIVNKSIQLSLLFYEIIKCLVKREKTVRSKKISLRTFLHTQCHSKIFLSFLNDFCASEENCVGFAWTRGIRIQKHVNAA